MAEPITVETLKELSPDNCFIAISRRVGNSLLEQPGYGGGENYLNQRSVLVAAVRTGVVRLASAVIIRKPLPDEKSGAFLLARFWMNCHIINSTMDTDVAFHCRLVTGSPQHNLRYTLILDNADYRDHPDYAPRPWRSGQRLHKYSKD